MNGDWIETVPWVIAVVAVLAALKVISTLGERIQRGLADLRQAESEEEEQQRRATSSERLQAGEKMPPIEPH